MCMCGYGNIVDWFVCFVGEVYCELDVVGW